MSWNNKVIWSEGMFMQPQHFQQHTRYVESYVEQRCVYLQSYPWGFGHLQVDRQLLRLGKLSISSASGVFPDGTPFNIPDDDSPPLPLDIESGVRDMVVYLAIPARRVGVAECDNSRDPKLLARYHLHDYDARDTNAGSENVAPVQVGKMRLSLLLDREQKQGYTCMGVGRVAEVHTDETVKLDDHYLPPMLDTRVSPRLSGFLKELHGVLHQRGDALAGRVSESGRGGVAEVASFLWLQVINRYEPVAAHLAEAEGLHPVMLYRLILEITGELATFASSTRRPPSFPAYRHDDLESTFEPALTELRQYLGRGPVEVVHPIELEYVKKAGMYKATIADRGLLDRANFILAVNAAMTTEEVRKRFPAQVKVGPVERIRELVMRALPGIHLQPLAVAPRQIPFHSGYVYFELDRTGRYWKLLTNSAGFGLHIGGEFPDIEMELWAIEE
ncbi:MAG: type VI secretion system baseplate subunit TssK [Gammaproteobacteria bacterium]|nr:type VI secretion system baseplate subunit TssK [Gammaproteobacteria bacterium]